MVEFQTRIELAAGSRTGIGQEDRPLTFILAGAAARLSRCWATSKSGIVHNGGASPSAKYRFQGKPDPGGSVCRHRGYQHAAPKNNAPARAVFQNAAAWSTRFCSGARRGARSRCVPPFVTRPPWAWPPNEHRDLTQFRRIVATARRADLIASSSPPRNAAPKFRTAMPYPSRAAQYWSSNVCCALSMAPGRGMNT